MEKSNLTKIIFSKKTSDYTFAVLFLLIFSIFIVFAIRPSLTTAASLKKEEKDLLKIDALYENKIMDIALVQSQIEENRDSLFLLNDAVSEYPQVNKMIEDVKKIADENDLFIKKASIADVNLLKNQKSIDKISMIVEGSINFDNLVKFLTQNASAGVSINPITLIAKIIYPFYSNFLFLDINSIYGKLLGIFALVLIIIGIYKLDLKSKLEHLFLVIWILVVTLGFLFYKGHIPEYYFFQALLPAVIIVAIGLKHNIYLLLIFVFIFSLSNLHEIKNFKSFVNYQAKKKIVDYVTFDSRAQSYNVIYEVPLGFKTGYDYLFKIKNKQPQENGKNLYIIGIGEGASSIAQTYRQKFQMKAVAELKIKENVHVVSVK